MFNFSLIVSSGRWQYDYKAFLFSLVNKPGWAPVKLPKRRTDRLPMKIANNLFLLVLGPFLESRNNKRTRKPLLLTVVQDQNFNSFEDNIASVNETKWTLFTSWIRCYILKIF